MPLFGNYLVVPTGTAMTRAWKLANGRMRDYQILRRHGLKLAHWPVIETSAPGADLDWEWVKTVQEKRIGELRVDEVIGGHGNIRIIFFKANKRLEGDPLVRIWLLTVFDKKRQDFSSGQIDAWRGMRDLIIHRWYGGDTSA